MKILNRTFRAEWMLGPILLAGVAGCPPPSNQPDRGGIPVPSPGLLQEGVEPMAIQITTTAFAEGEPIPKKYTGEGVDVSPPLVWTAVPEGTRELALICDDPDAPVPQPWVHWVIYKIPSETTSLPEGVPQDAKLSEPSGALQGKNGWPDGENLGYRGPMPPPGHGTHRYFFKLYALDAELNIEAEADKDALIAAMSGHVIGEGQLMGTYER